MGEIKDTHEVTALVVDYGLFTDLAARLAREFKRVLYYVPWEASYTRMHPAHVGYGIEGLELVESPFGPWYQDVDLFVFTELGFPHLQTWLESEGKKVWGARCCEDIEACREGTHELLKDLGLPSPRYENVTGFAALRSYLKTHPGVWVKISKWRGHFETFFAEDYDRVAARLDDIERDMGPLGDLATFMLEEDLPDRIESGVDGFTVDGQLPHRVLTGLEVKDRAYAGRIVDWGRIPEPLRRFDEAMAPIFKEKRYRGFYAAEVRVGADHQPYMIDFCARAPTPPGELWQEMYANLGDMVWRGANGILVDPVPIAEYGCEVMIESVLPDTEWQSVCFPEKFRDRVKLRNVARVGDCYHIVPLGMHLSDFGWVLGTGDSLEEAIRTARETASHVHGAGAYVDLTALDDVQREVQKMWDFGLESLGPSADGSPHADALRP